MDKYKQALLVYFNKTKEFLLKKNENSKIKYKNLTVCGIGLLVFILICLMLVPSKQNNNTMMLHPNDVSSSNEEVSFADNNAVAVTPSTDDETSLQIQNKTESENKAQTEELTEEYSAPDTQADEANIEEPTQNEDSAQANQAENSDQTVQSKGTYLYCGKYKSQKDASEHKATLAFSAGLISSAVEKNGNFTLKIGPFKSRDEAVSAFEKMDKLSLVDECQLETE